MADSSPGTTLAQTTPTAGASLPEIRTYFQAKADAYDDVDAQPYWMLSDELLWWALENYVLPRLPEGFRFLDAGGGTGRWTHRFATNRPDSSGLLYDLTPEMSDHARRKADAHGYPERLRVRNGDLADVGTELAGERFDLIFNFHNVLGFVADPGEVIASLAGLLTRRGLLVSFVPSRWHAAFFNLSLGNVAEAERCLAGRGGFTDTMPDMHLFTPDGLTELHRAAGLGIDVLTGFPSLLYPGYQETQLHGSTDRLERLLSDRAQVERLIALEQRTMAEPAAVGRGNNLFSVASRERTA
ncbi:class I SAM-dependent methyltransferase [Streptomyces varsoviensis]|uniref:class I SAM-dependent methyltransferase n=1 Tax=Streptomyces varsoviensis TaxID=67373 RepID=UPI0033C7A374